MDEAANHALAAIEQFLKSSRRPALLEPGEEYLVLEPGAYSLERRNGRLALQAWDEKRNLVRRIARVAEEKPGKIELAVERFGKREGRLLLVDLARGDGQEAGRRGTRLVLREQFRRFLSRRFPDWKIAELSAERNLHESLSETYPRAFLKKGAAGWAALASPQCPDAAAGALTFGLVWLDFLRRRERRLTMEGLILYLPFGQERTACLRLPFLNQQSARFTVFVYTTKGSDEQADLRDYGNLDTRLETCCAANPERPAHLDAWLERLRAIPQVQSVDTADGGVILSVNGLEIARANRTELLFGIHERTAAREGNLREIEQLAAEVARVRAPDAASHEHPLYRMRPERWLESRARAQLEVLDASLVPTPVYGQVPAMAGGDRGIMDLLAVGRDGRLAVMELKAFEDIHLPLQALDYWMRVKWHLDRNEFSERGYFPGTMLRPDPPRLLLVAPSLEFHPQTEVILRYFSPDVDVERIGLGVEWRKGLKVMFRIRQADSPV